MNAARIAGQMRRRMDEELEQLAAEVTRQYVNREFQCQTVPMEKRGPNVYRQPQTALIAYAAQRAMLRREIWELARWRPECSTAMGLEEQVNDLIAIRDFLLSRKQGQKVSVSRFTGDECITAPS